MTLDQALLAGDQGTIDQLRDTGDSYDAKAALQELLTNSADQVLQGKNTTEDTRSMYQNEFDVGREDQEIADRAEIIRQQAADDYKTKLDAIKAQFKASEFENLQVADPTYFDSNRYNQIDKYNVASAEDYNRLKALEALTGNNSSLSPFSDLAGKYTQYADADSAFNKDKFLSDRDTVKSARLKTEQQQRDYEASQNQAASERDQAKKDAEKKATYTAVGASAGAVAGSFVPVVGTVAGAVVGGLIGAAVCFEAHTPVKLASGYSKLLRILN